MLILPLIVSSIISSLAQLDAQSSGKMGVRALIYYLGTTLIAAIIGIILVLTIQPGSRGNKVEINPDSKSAEGRTIDTVLDLFRNLFPDNIMEATFRSVTILKLNKTRKKDFYVLSLSLLLILKLIEQKLLDLMEQVILIHILFLC